MKNNYCVIMAGGIGSRFWPMSRNAFPKQFLDILGTGKTLLQQTYERFLNICPKEHIFIVTNEAYVDLVRNQLPDVSAAQVLGEPHRKNTAPCIAYASYKISHINPAANVIVAPSDHIILKDAEFTSAVLKGLDFVSKNDSLLTLGIQPSRPDTGYGYIQFIDDKVSETNKISRVKTFTEKPNLDMAKFFLQTGEFLWNAGIFMWNVKTIHRAIGEHLPEIDSLFREASAHFEKPEEGEYVRKAYEQCTNISIDFGVMEKARNVFVMSADFGWSDLGTYGSLYEHIRLDSNANAVIGRNVILYDTKNCFISMPKDKLVVLQGLDDYIVVESDNVLLICKKQDEQQIRQFVNDVKLTKGDKYI
jgi:mannose-1-phosphate guanylyltransferase